MLRGCRQRERDGAQIHTIEAVYGSEGEMTVLEETQAELLLVKAELAEREAAKRAPLVAEQQRVDAMRGEIDTLAARVNALKLQTNGLKPQLPFMARPGGVLRLALAIGCGFASMLAGSSWGVWQMVPVALVLIVVGRRSRE